MPVLDIVTRRNRTLPSAAVEAWSMACDELGLALNRKSGLALGRVDGHDVEISPIGESTDTRYKVQLDTPHVPPFSLTHSAQSAGAPSDAKFESLVAIRTDHELRMLDFLTSERREQIRAALERWEHVTMTSTEAVVVTPGVQMDDTELVSSAKQLVTLAHAVSPCWAEVDLDERSVLDDLFNSDREFSAITKRFDDLYKASEITWTGEIVQVGEISQSGRIIMLMVGAANGSMSSSRRSGGAKWGGRVVVTTTIDADEQVQRGDVVTFTGGLLHIDAERRMLRVQDLDLWKLR